MSAIRPLVLAHRGACHRVRENTVEAFALARELGADGIELDVRRSADDVLIVHHDAEVPEVGLLAAQPFDGIRAALPWLPTLAEALEVCTGWLVNVEIKCLPWEADADPEHTVARGSRRSRAAIATFASSCRRSTSAPSTRSARTRRNSRPRCWCTAKISRAQPALTRGAATSG